MAASPAPETQSKRREKQAPRGDILPMSTPVRGLREAGAAAYIDVSVTHFRKMVEAGKMPKPKLAGDRTKVWDRLALDAAFAALPEDGDDGNHPKNPWDDGPI
jgi:hypothetical protein